jgi:hypothetical protein
MKFVERPHAMRHQGDSACGEFDLLLAEQDVSRRIKRAGIHAVFLID